MTLVFPVYPEGAHFASWNAPKQLLAFAGRQVAEASDRHRGNIKS